MQECIRQFLIWFIDTIFDCAFVEERYHYWEDEQCWQDSIMRCSRCGKIGSMVTLPANFWEVERKPGEYTVDSLLSDW